MDPSRYSIRIVDHAERGEHAPPARRCDVPGCWGLTYDGKPYCRAHVLLCTYAAAVHARIKALGDAARPSAGPPKFVPLRGPEGGSRE